MACSVRAPAELTRVFFSLGSNLGDRESHLRAAVAGLSAFVQGMRVSSLYETDPLYFTRQPKFLNVVVTGSCRLPPAELLHGILGLEAKLGRDRRQEVPKGPRVIDVDLLLYGELVLESSDLQIPHPRLRERQFVLVPLLEIEPRARDPVSGRAYARISAILGDQGVYMFGPWTYNESSTPIGEA